MVLGEGALYKGTRDGHASWVEFCRGRVSVPMIPNLDFVTLCVCEVGFFDSGGFSISFPSWRVSGDDEGGDEAICRICNWST
jgi:hypothetical protein